jgi:D-glycero-alpha-D-manno-heptose-7-phosphate kinase
MTALDHAAGIASPRSAHGTAPIVRARAPLRLGLAGGGTDVSPYADLYGGAVMNATIDRYIYASLSPAPDGQVIVESQDLGLSLAYPAEAPLPMDGRLDLTKAVYNRISERFRAFIARWREERRLRGEL